jgi:predicted enzyme related to lactoylglutathione lyase
MTWLQHVNVVVPEGGTDAAASFYESVFSLTQQPKPAGAGSPIGAWLTLEGKQQIHISERSGERHPDAHFAVVADDFDGVLERIAAAGAMWQGQEDIFGGRRGFTRDPAGNRIEVLEATGEFAG